MAFVVMGEEHTPINTTVFVFTVELEDDECVNGRSERASDAILGMKQ